MKISSVVFALLAFAQALLRGKKFFVWLKSRQKIMLEFEVVAMMCSFVWR